MTAETRQRASSPVIWVGIIAVIALVVLVAFGSRDDTNLGGVADPNGTSREGLLALRLLVEETGGTFDSTVHAPAPSHDVAILGRDVYTDYLSEFNGGPDRTVENHQPIIDWVEAGGVLLTGVPVPQGPNDSSSFEESDTTVLPGECTISSLSEVESIRVLPHNLVTVGPNDTSCFGDGSEAVVVVRVFGEGRIIRVASISLFFNQVLDDDDNAALAARLMQLQPDRSVAFLIGPDPAVGGFDGPVNEDGEPIGAGDETLLDLVPVKVIAFIVGLAGACFVYALSRGRRLGSPVIEPLPIELPSSTYVEAVGRMYHQAENPRARSAAVLRDDFRTAAARRIGLPAAAPTEDIAAALSIAAGDSKEDLVALLRDAEPSSDEELVDIASRLSDHRTRFTKGTR